VAQGLEIIQIHGLRRVCAPHEYVVHMGTGLVMFLAQAFDVAVLAGVAVTLQCPRPERLPFRALIEWVGAFQLQDDNKNCQ
jgi:hypothetical protein